MNDTTKKAPTAAVKLEGQTAHDFDAVKKDLMRRVPSMRNPHNTDVVMHGLFLAAEALKKRGTDNG